MDFFLGWRAHTVLVREGSGLESPGIITRVFFYGACMAHRAFETYILKK